MDLDFIRKICLSFPGVTEAIQWGCLIFKVGGKWFVFCRQNKDSYISIKSNPEKYNELIEIPGVIPAPYLAKNKWIAIQNKNGLKARKIKNLIKESYDLVFSKLPKKFQNEITNISPSACLPVQTGRAKKRHL